MTWDGIEAALENVWLIVDDCLDFITSNAALMIFFTAGLIPIGFRIFKRAKRSVK